jgi:hypothetical protein
MSGMLSLVAGSRGNKGLLAGTLALLGLKHQSRRPDTASQANLIG